MTATFDFIGQNVFVFGGTSGINLGIAQAFARSGASVAVASRSQDKVDRAVDGLGGSAQHDGYALDVRDYASVEAALQAFSSKVGTIDVLISGAAGNFPAKAENLSPNGFKSVVDIDLLGTFHVAKAAFAYLTKPGASIINISAPQAFIPMAMQVHVCAAKAGVDMVTKTLAIEWGGEGIRVNSVVPGPIEGTEGMDRLAPNDDVRNRVIHSVPLKRMGDASDVADVCQFLASDAARYVSGVVLPADGGWAAAGAKI